MTPKRGEFEEKLEAAASSFAMRVTNKGVGWDDGALEKGFTHGARWARAQTIKDVIEALRSDEAKAKCKKLISYGSCPNAEDFADWLEDRFKEGK